VVLVAVACCQFAAAEEDAWKIPNFMGGETLYNGIVMPQEWPPYLKELPADPVTPFYIASPPPVILIDVGRQLFVDDFLIKKTTLTRSLHRPEYYPGNPLIKQGMPLSSGVWFDPKDGLFKAWYIGGGVRYATSTDGIHWDLPKLSIVTPDTNLVLDANNGADTVWLDLEEKDPARRFKMFQSATRDEKNRMWMRFSADGIHWSDLIRKSGSQGDRSSAFYNPFRKVWVFSRRQGWGTPRFRRYWEVRDLVNGPYWENIDQPLCIWTGADSQDPVRPDYVKITQCQLYNLDAVAYESLMLGGFAIWRGHPVYRNKLNDLCVGFSRDGWSWSRPDRRPFCPISESYTDWNWVNVQSAGGFCAVMGDQLYFYVSGRRSWEQNMGMAVLRRDGFVSMSAGGEAPPPPHPAARASSPGKARRILAFIQQPSFRRRAGAHA
jgi:hypothetical protein